MNDDAERIQELADDDEAAKALIYRKFYRAVFLEAYRILENYEEAEETTNDAFVKAFKTLHQLSEAAKFLAWLRTIARNLAIDRLRETKHRGYQVPFDDTQSHYIGDAVDYRTTEQGDITRTRITLANRLLRLLPSKDRLAMELHDIEGCTYQQIADLTHTTERAVANRVRRTRNLLITVANRFDDWLLDITDEARKAIDLLAVIPTDEAEMAEHYLLDQDSLAETARLMHLSPRVVVKGLKHAMKQWRIHIAG